MTTLIKTHKAGQKGPKQATQYSPPFSASAPFRGGVRFSGALTQSGVYPDTEIDRGGHHLLSVICNKHIGGVASSALFFKHFEIEVCLREEHFRTFASEIPSPYQGDIKLLPKKVVSDVVHVGDTSLPVQRFRLQDAKARFSFLGDRTAVSDVYCYWPSDCSVDFCLQAFWYLSIAEYISHRLTIEPSCTQSSLSSLQPLSDASAIRHLW